MMCCPLSGSDDCESPSVYDSSTPVAARARKCSECGDDIPKGAKYERIKGCWDGAWSTYSTCLSCVEIRDHFACNGFLFGSLWSDLEENFFPEMKMGGPCMEGLSPEAKLRLVTLRMEWYFDQGEVDAIVDERWEHWVKRADRTTPPPGIFAPIREPAVDIEEQRARDRLAPLSEYEHRAEPAGNGW